MRCPALPRSFLAIALAAPSCARAADARPSPDLHLSYGTYAAALHVANLDATFRQDAAGYQIDLAYSTTGLFGTLVHSAMDTRAQGAWDGQQARPLQFYAYGTTRGRPHRTWIEYRDGAPVIRDLQPPNEEEREPVPPGREAGSIDTLSAMAELVRQVAETGRCDGIALTFDGRRLSRISAHTAGTETLTADHGSAFAGPALRCDFEGRVLAGFRKDEAPGRQRRPLLGSAWFARVAPDQPPVPVRIAFQTSWVGVAVAYLTRAGG